MNYTVLVILANILTTNGANQDSYNFVTTDLSALSIGKGLKFCPVFCPNNIQKKTKILSVDELYAAPRRSVQF